MERAADSQERLLVIVFARATAGPVLVISGRDMNTAERRYYRRERGA